MRAITKNFKLVSWAYIAAFFVGLIPVKLLAPVITENLPGLINPETFEATGRFYALTAFNHAVWAACTVFLYAKFKALPFDATMCLLMILFFCAVGVGTTYCLFNGIGDPRLMVVGLVLNFGFGWFLAAKRLSSTNASPARAN